jgi:hypothetical protein
MRISHRLPIVSGILLFLLTGVADATSTTCATSTVCAEYINTSSGVAIHGEANTGIGIRGTSNTSTGFYGASRSGIQFFPGVEGESLNNDGNDAAAAFGIAGNTGGPISTAQSPAYGVLAYATSVGVFAVSTAAGNTNSYGEVAGAAMNGRDLGGAPGNDSNAAVLGATRHGAGVIGVANTPYYHSNVVEYSLFGDYPIGVIGDAEPDQSGGEAIGVVAESSSVPLIADNPTVKTTLGVLNADYALVAVNYAQSNNAYDFFTLDNSGNINAASLTTTKGTYARTTGTSGTARTLYTPHTSSPVTEDFGEGQLVNGRGYVRLDPALADVIDNSHAYHVFLTPEGDSKGLYVTEKTPAGFVVRESSGGRSTLSFEYRILAKPVDENGVRLAVAPPLPRTDPLLSRARPHRSSGRPPLPLDPFDRLKLKLGPAGYARALAAARQNQIGR